jgi:hypothetical protein
MYARKANQSQRSDFDDDFAQFDPDEMVPVKRIDLDVVEDELAPSNVAAADPVSEDTSSEVSARPADERTPMSTNPIEMSTNSMIESTDASGPARDLVDMASTEEAEDSFPGDVPVIEGKPYQFPRMKRQKKVAAPVTELGSDQKAMPVAKVAIQMPGRAIMADLSIKSDPRYVRAMKRHPAFRWKQPPQAGERWKLSLHPVLW